MLVYMEPIFSILVIDDEPEIINSIKRLFIRKNYSILSAATGEEALQILKIKNVDAVVLDLRLPDIDGLSLLKTIKMMYSSINVLILTGYASIKDAVEATQSGAIDFIEKEYLGEHLPNRIGQLNRIWQLDRENTRLRDEIAKKDRFQELIGNSTSMLSLKDTILRISSTDSSVLVLGETGSGKELVAQGIHHQSPRSEGPFVPVDCAAINNSTFESELFGHSRGAFTGAGTTHDGLIRSSNGGSIFFDEIGELPMNVQAKLLRSIQEKEVRPVGSTKSTPVDFRVIAATNRDLEAEVRQGNFREDLFYRLNAIPLQVPPLRNRNEDVILLFRYFVKKYSVEDTTPFIEESVFDDLLHYDWPGNVRELQNTARHAVAFYQRGMISSADLPDRIKGRLTMKDSGPSSITTMEDQEMKAILQALTEHNGNRRKAAEQLGIGEATIYRKIKKYNIQP